MTGIPGHPGNGSPGMHSLVISDCRGLQTVTAMRVYKCIEYKCVVLLGSFHNGRQMKHHDKLGLQHDDLSLTA